MTTQTLLLPPEPHHRVSRDRARELFAKMRDTVAAMIEAGKKSETISLQALDNLPRVEDR
jgi:hypothetical protein